MSKRLQVVMDERELGELRRAARAENLTLSSWVRRVLHRAVSRQPGPSTKRKLEVIRNAARYEFPAPDIEQMNAEIARGYTAGWER